MMDSDFLKRLERLGFPLFHSTESEEACRTLADVVLSKDARLWEGFPVVLATAEEKGLFDYDKVKLFLKEVEKENDFNSLVMLALALYDAMELEFSWNNGLRSKLLSFDQEEYQRLVKYLKQEGAFTFNDQVLSSGKVKETFENYFHVPEVNLNEFLSVKEDFDFEYSLSQVFSPKQKELVLKKLKREKLSKTEREYFSRVVRKKLLALANPHLYRLAQKLLS